MVALNNINGLGSNSSRPAEHNRPILICFSHLRWDFVFQRPQHIMTRLAEHYAVIFWEEAVSAEGEPRLSLSPCDDSGVTIVTPQLPDGLSGEAREEAKRLLLEEFLPDGANVAWYYTPMMQRFSRDLRRDRTVYDCMDELTGFLGASELMASLEDELLSRADVVFTGGRSLYEAKRGRNTNVHCFPSAVDLAHFARARAVPPSGAPVFGWFGVIDERLDLKLVEAVAAARPDWRFVMAGPVVKIDPADLPKLPNIVWPGSVAYEQLPERLTEWSVALMPFAHNAATRFISPTKAPEYLAGGRPVVSTGIKDVVTRFGHLQGVSIADGAEAFVTACEEALALSVETKWLTPVDALLEPMSWNSTVAKMRTELVGQPVASPSRKPHYDVLVVGAGFAGSVMAERLANDAGLKIRVIDRRPHIAGNAFDERNTAGLLTHRYGPHIFHTNSDDVAAYLSRFTGWRSYEHRVLAEVRNQLVPMPINRTTLNRLFGLAMTSDAEVEAFLAARAEPVEVTRTSEDVVVGKVGRELYELFFRGYTRKQWALDPSELDKSVTARVPTRTNTDDRYFTDTFQNMPSEGYTRMFETMLDHPNITVSLASDFATAAQECSWDHLVFTGPVDEYFDWRFGRLPYRSLRFEHETLDQASYQPVGTVNYPDEAVPFTRISEYKYLTGDESDWTSITREYPSAVGDPYYPIPRQENQELYRRYRDLADATAGVTFVGRLATYRYFNMDQVVAQALATYRRLKENGFASAVEPAAAQAVA